MDEKNLRNQLLALQNYLSNKRCFRGEIFERLDDKDYTYLQAYKKKLYKKIRECLSRQYLKNELILRQRSLRRKAPCQVGIEVLTENLSNKNIEYLRQYRKKLDQYERDCKQEFKQEYKQEYKFSDCDIGRYIESVKGQPSNSFSPSETLIVKFKDNLLFDDKPVYKGFLKIFVNDTKYPKINLLIKGLLYEQKVYRLIRLFKTNRFCPYFVLSLADANNCSLDQYREILKKTKGVSEYVVVSKILKRSLYYMTTGDSNRPAVHDLKFDDSKMLDELTGIKFNYILTKKQEGITLDEFLINSSKVYHGMAIFQLLIALYAMEYLRLVHNDLHVGNIFVTKGKRRKIKYVIDNVVYTYDNLGINVKIYDFDRSYCQYLGKNELLEKLCPISYYDECNIFEKKRDFERVTLGKFMNNILREYGIDKKNTIKNMIESLSERLNIAKRIYDKSEKYNYRIDRQKAQNIRYKI